MDERQPDKGVAGARSLHIILAETAKAVQPAEGTLDKPAVGLHRKALADPSLKEHGGRSLRVSSSSHS